MNEADPIVAGAESNLPRAVHRVTPRQALGESERFFERRKRRIDFPLFVADLAQLRQCLRPAEELLVAEFRLRHGGEVVHRLLTHFVEQLQPANGAEACAEIAEHEAYELFSLPLPTQRDIARRGNPTRLDR